MRVELSLARVSNNIISHSVPKVATLRTLK